MSNNSGAVESSVHLAVVKEYARNYRLFRREKKRQSEKRSNLKMIYSEQVAPAQRHPHAAANAGFS